MEDRFDAVDVTVKRDEGVTIVFADGHQAELDLVTVRLACPCADCRVRRSSGQVGWPLPESPLPLRIADAEFHGGWGLAITWNDGHSTGIYPFETMRRWSDNGHTG